MTQLTGIGIMRKPKSLKMFAVIKLIRDISPSSPAVEFHCHASGADQGIAVSL